LISKSKVADNDNGQKMCCNAIKDIVQLIINQWDSQPKIWGGVKKLGGGKMFDFRRATVFCLGRRFSEHKITIYAKIWETLALWATPWLRLCCKPETKETGDIRNACLFVQVTETFYR